MRTSWNIINKEKGNSRDKSRALQIIFKNKLITNQCNLNRNKESNHLIRNSAVYLSKLNHRSFTNINWHNTSTHEIEKIIRSLKVTNSTGYDEISIRIIKFSLPFIISPLTHICNAALKNGVFPDRLKYATVKPILKKRRS
jgi:hypothetical protein